MLIPLGTNENNFKSVLFTKYLHAVAFEAVCVGGPGDPGSPGEPGSPGDPGFKGGQELRTLSNFCLTAEPLVSPRVSQVGQSLPKGGTTTWIDRGHTGDVLVLIRCGSPALICKSLLLKRFS